MRVTKRFLTISELPSSIHAIPSTDPEDMEEAIEAAEKAREKETRH